MKTIRQLLLQDALTFFGFEDFSLETNEESVKVVTIHKEWRSGAEWALPDLNCEQEAWMSLLIREAVAD